ncbi:copper resistance CopC family protein [Gemmatimonas sp.]|jgi:hypothetical protein|uniref:copper resistance CopC family protein n=1 Tax=Gemmatimonas sp. TaxID=1962908 RepID=UPI0033407574
MIRFSRLAVPAFVTVLALPLVAGAARLPHLKLKRAFPAADTTLTTSPDAVRLWLSEPADLPATKVAVTDAAGAPVDVAKLTRGAQREDPVVAKFVTPPKSGKYTVTWKAMSKDGHVVDGKYAFTVTLAK